MLVPAELKLLVRPIESLICSASAAIASARLGGGAIDYAAIERAIEERAAEIESATHASVLPSLAVDAPRVSIHGKSYTRVVRDSPGTYHTMTGPVAVVRSLYREDGVRNGPAVDAISLRAGAFDGGWLPKTAAAMAHLLQQGTAREAVESAKQAGRLPYSRASFDRVGHAVGREWQHHHADIEDALIVDMELPDAACSISVALDRVSVPMEEPAKKPVGRPRKGAPKNPIHRNFRMAYCGAVTLHDEAGRALYTIRRGCMPKGDPAMLCQLMANDVRRMVDERPTLRIKLLADGAAEMWNLLEGAFPREVFGEVRRGVDFWHMIEKLAPAAKVVFGEEAAKEELRRWKDRLLRTDKAALEIFEELLASGHEDTWRDSEQPVHNVLTYINSHVDRMNYASDRSAGLPIGSGNIEATCKTLVGVRMKRAGSRWKHETGGHILQIRSLALSDRFEPAMAKLHAARRTAVRVAA
jgi:hypothetical protein